MRSEAALPQGAFMADINLPYYSPQKAPSGIDSIDFVKMFPSAFLMLLSVLFLVPVWILVYIGTTSGAEYFISNAFWSSLAIPPAIVLSYILLQWRLAPQKWVVIFMLIVPSLLLLWISQAMYTGAVDKTVKLVSGDCSSFPQKRQLQMSWEAAYDLYSTCINETSAQQGYSREVLMANFRIQDCEEYQQALTSSSAEGALANIKNYKEDWKYLRQLEETQMCTGWCYEGIQLWSTTPHKDSCSSVVANLFSAFVSVYAWQLAVLMLAFLSAFVVLLILLGPLLRRTTGGKW